MQLDSKQAPFNTFESNLKFGGNSDIEISDEKKFYNITTWWIWRHFQVLLLHSSPSYCHMLSQLSFSHSDSLNSPSF